MIGVTIQLLMFLNLKVSNLFAYNRKPCLQPGKGSQKTVRTCSVRAPSVAWRHILGHRLRQICRREEPSAQNHFCLAAGPEERGRTFPAQTPTRLCEPHTRNRDMASRCRKHGLWKYLVVRPLVSSIAPASTVPSATSLRSQGGSR